MFLIKVADIVVQIDNRYPDVRNLCVKYEVFDQEPMFTVSASEEELLKEQNGCAGFSLGYCECLCIYRNLCLQLIRYDAFLMHSAVVEMDGKAYAFAAASGTGKSTHIALWEQVFGDLVTVVNGDKPIYRFFGDTLYACGTPWQGKEGKGNNIMSPLKAVCFLERSTTNSIRKIGQSEVIGRIFHQVLMPKNQEEFERFMNLIERMMNTTEFYLLQCNTEPEAAEVAYQGMKG